VTSVNPIEGLVDLTLVEVEPDTRRKPQRSPVRAASKKRGRGGK
jgi:hypothetical protein